MKNKSFLLKTLLTCFVMLVVLSVSSFAVLHGDVDGDGEVAAADARSALRFSVGLDKLTEVQQVAADVDFSKEVAADDARLILRFSVGLEQIGHRFPETFTPETKVDKKVTVLTGRHYRECPCGDREVFNCAFGDRVYKTKLTKPTCTESTRFTQTCSVCKAEKVGGEAALGHSKPSRSQIVSKAPACNEEGYEKYTCTRCKVLITEKIKKTVHQKPNSKMCVPFKCQLCGNTDYRLFNDLVNPLKNGTHTYKSYTRIDDVDKTTQTVFNLSKDAEALIKSAKEDPEEFKREIANTSNPNTSSVVHQGNMDVTSLGKDNFPIIGNNIVSMLSEGDISSFKVTSGLTKVDLFDSIKIEEVNKAVIKGALAGLKTKENRNVIKVELAIPENSISSSTAQTALERIEGTKISEYSKQVENKMKEYANDLKKELGGTDGEAESEFGLSLNINMSNLTSNFNLAYYFDADTLEPIAAKYCKKIKSYHKITLDFDINLDVIIGELSPDAAEMLNVFFPGKSSIDIMDGYMDFENETTTTTYYFFDGYYN